ncbi:hypothetical protein COLO4_34762 [Corchorus olitorius]|uniref:Uncharacterized protein n=1 Tax=Corchorus olitorius TaxID=93759 RepID=A0A1R3GJN0_9ROSI|nr:hypothetical protein COLO4_34762 [Corchorus olitorius]
MVVVLPQTVEAAISRTCSERKLQPLRDSTRYFIGKDRPNYNVSPQKRLNPSSSSSSPFSFPVKTVKWMIDSPEKGAVQALVTPPPRSGSLANAQEGREMLEKSCSANEIRELKDLEMDEFEDRVWRSKGRIFSPSGRCKDEDGNPVCNNDGEPQILTDGTGYISEDLTLKYPKNVFKGSIVKGYNLEDKLSGMNSGESHHRVPPGRCRSVVSVG